MGNKIADIKVGLPSRRMTKHTMDYSANLTMNFGEVNSLGFLEMDGNTKAKGSIKSLVRMSPLPLPTFGELSYKTYARFIPIKDIYRNFENLRGARSLTTQFGTFTPTSVPVITIRQLSQMILTNFCKFSVYASYESVNVVASTHQNVLEYSGIKQLDIEEDQEAARILTAINAFDTYYGTDLEDIYFSNDLFSPQVTSENCDFILGVTDETDSTNGGCVLCFRLTRLGKVVYRNLLSLGYKFDWNNTNSVSILPILAFYKGYYDLFMPANTANANRNYTDTYAFRVCDYCAEHDTKNVLTSDSTIQDLWINFITTEFSKVFYYQDPDFITSMIASPSISPATAPSLSSPNSLVTLSESSYTSQSLSNRQPTLTQSNGQVNGSMASISALNIKLALRLLPYVNKDTIIGGKLRELIKSRFGYDVETLEGESYTAGRYNLPIQISALTNSADTQSSDGTSGQVLGQQGGLGVAYTKDECLRYNFKAKEYGFLMFYSVIVPKAGFFQGINPALKHGINGRFSLYDPAFDSLGFDLHTKDLVLGENLCCSSPWSGTFAELNLGSVAYGFSPRYFDYKNKAHSIVSGDLARNQFRDKYSAYYLDKLITPNVVTTETDSVTGEVKLTFYDNRSNIPTATPDLRQIGYQDWLENFNRIFYQYSLISSKSSAEMYSPLEISFVENFGVDDNFVADNLIACDYFDHSKPSSESFETDGEGKFMNVSHA